MEKTYTGGKQVIKLKKEKNRLLITKFLLKRGVGQSVQT